MLLKNLTVLSLTEYGAGSLIGSLLAMMGANVYKIENPLTKGDSGRKIPPGVKENESLFFEQMNQGVKSVVLDKKTSEGQKIFLKMVQNCDVLVTNRKGISVEKEGLTFDHLKKYNPKIICCALTGYGRYGPLQAEPAYDYLLQARYGIMSLTGGTKEIPTRSFSAFIDTCSAIQATNLITAGLVHSHRTGNGCQLDTSMMDAALQCLFYLPIWYFNTDYQPKKTDWSAHPSVVPSRMFQTKNGYIIIMCQTQKFWEELCMLTQLTHLLSDGRFSTFELRFQNKKILEGILEENFSLKTTEYWIQLLTGKVPVAPVNSLEDSLQDEHLAASDLLTMIDHPVFGNILKVGTPFMVNGIRPGPYRSPLYGEHTIEALEKLANIKNQPYIEHLAQRGIISIYKK